MRHKIIEFVFVVVFLFVMIFNMVGLAFESFSYSIEDLPKGKLLHPILSPDTTKTLQIYLVEIKNVGYAIRGEIIPNNGGDSKNIYWETDTKSAIGAWIDENTVSINGHDVKIDGDPYDSRKQIQLPEASAKGRTLG